MRRGTQVTARDPTRPRWSSHLDIPTRVELPQGGVDFGNRRHRTPRMTCITRGPAPERVRMDARKAIPVAPPTRACWAPMARQVFWLGCHPPKRAFPRGPHSQWHCCASASTLTAAGPPRIRTGFPWSSLVLFPDNYVAATPTVKSLRACLYTKSAQSRGIMCRSTVVDCADPMAIASSSGDLRG